MVCLSMTGQAHALTTGRAPPFCLRHCSHRLPRASRVLDLLEFYSCRGVSEMVSWSGGKFNECRISFERYIDRSYGLLRLLVLLDVP